MRARAFPGSGSEVEARYQRAGQWIRATILGDFDAANWCSRNGVLLIKAASETVGGSGGFLVPKELANAIYDIREQYGAFRRRARIEPMASDSTAVPRRLGSTSAYFTAESTAPSSESSATFDVINLTAKKVAALVRISSEVDEDAISDIVDAVANEIAFAFAAKEDDCAFNGDGTSTYAHMRGIGTIVLDGNHTKAKVTAASGHNTFLTLDATDLANLMGSVRAAAVPNAGWYCSQTGFAQTFCRLAGSSGYLSAEVVDGIYTPYYMGFPVIFTQKLPLSSSSLTGQTMMVFGDMYLGAVLGQRRAITLARSSDRYLDSDQIAVLGTERFHAVVHDLGDNTSYGALAALVAP